LAGRSLLGEWRAGRQRQVPTRYFHCTASEESNDTERCIQGPADNSRNQKQLKRPCPIGVRGNTRDGKYVRQTLKKVLETSTRDWNAALQLVREWEQMGSQPKPAVEAVRITVEQLRDMCLQHMRAENLSTETIRKAKFLFSQLTAFAEQQALQFVDEFARTQMEASRNSWTDGALPRQKRDERERARLFPDTVIRVTFSSRKGATSRELRTVQQIHDHFLRIERDQLEQFVFVSLLLLRSKVVGALGGVDQQRKPSQGSAPGQSASR
jgi:hypothetical protein